MDKQEHDIVVHFDNSIFTINQVDPDRYCCMDMVTDVAEVTNVFMSDSLSNVIIAITVDRLNDSGKLPKVDDNKPNAENDDKDANRHEVDDVDDDWIVDGDDAPNVSYEYNDDTINTQLDENSDDVFSDYQSGVKDMLVVQILRNLRLKWMKHIEGVDPDRYCCMDMVTDVAEVTNVFMSDSLSNVIIAITVDRLNDSGKLPKVDDNKPNAENDDKDANRHEVDDVDDDWIVDGDDAPNVSYEYNDDTINTQLDENSDDVFSDYQSGVKDMLVVQILRNLRLKWMKHIEGVGKEMALDGNKGLFPVVYGVIESERTKSWDGFFKIYMVSLEQLIGPNLGPLSQTTRRYASNL
ncbi:unnamed protein product [Ilex paraguariensis]|uniref:Uncharacterized protein n=1 Tax=Ilex paraguariensis TaxID=185542 RepID=A0ABC8SAX9_9AQUA